MRALLALLLALAAPLRAEEGRVLGVILGSAHVGSADLNDVNPGLTFGRRWDAGRAGMEWQAEGGVFWNSYEEVSPIVLGGLSQGVGRLGPGELRLGVAAGVARYAAVAGRLEGYGIPTVAGYVPVAAATVAWRHGRTEWRLSALPPDRSAGVRAIVNLSLAVAF